MTIASSLKNITRFKTTHHCIRKIMSRKSLTQSVAFNEI